MVGETLQARASFPLEAMSVADFLKRTTALVDRLGGRMLIHGAPNEIPDAKPFAEDTAPRPYDRDAVERFHRALVQIERVFTRFRTGFLGKVSPVHLFWGSFDLAVTRFSGRKAPSHPGGVPALPDAMTRCGTGDPAAARGHHPDRQVRRDRGLRRPVRLSAWLCVEQHWRMQSDTDAVAIRDGTGYVPGSPGSGTADHVAFRATNVAAVQAAESELSRIEAAPTSFHDRKYFTPGSAS